MILFQPRWDCDDRTMAAASAFETHRFVKRLTESGFTEMQAETLAEEHVTLLNANLTTKAHIEWLSGTQIVQGGLLLALASPCNAVHPFTV